MRVLQRGLVLKLPTWPAGGQPSGKEEARTSEGSTAEDTASQWEGTAVQDGPVLVVPVSASEASPGPPS